MKNKYADIAQSIVTRIKDLTESDVEDVLIGIARDSLEEAAVIAKNYEADGLTQKGCPCPPMVPHKNFCCYYDTDKVAELIRAAKEAL